MPGTDSSQTGSIVPPTTFLSGWRLVSTVSAIIMLVAFGIAYQYRLDVDGVRLVIRTTARSSLLLFGLAFTASALYRLWPNAWTRWQRNNRRYLGVSFAASHSMHAIAIAGFAQIDPKQFHEVVGMSTLVEGGLGYAFIAAMTVTSFDRTAAWIGPRAWRALHTTGAYYIWLGFLYIFGGAAIEEPFYRPFAAFVVLILVIRFVSIPARGRTSSAH
jgi:hypothetical protein